ncbi:MAG: NUDIX domain-containing protein [Bacteroidota bacterium]
MDRPMIGIGIIIENEANQILIGQRLGSHADQAFSIPGGHLELGETFEEAAIKEVLEETSMTIFDPKVICVTNNLRTYWSEQKHYISITLYTNRFEGVPKIMEPDRCASWQWVDPRALPQPHFDASEFSVECFLKQQFYIPNQAGAQLRAMQR